MKMRCLLLAGSFALLAFATLAQLSQPYRFAVEQRPNKPTFSMISLGQRGLALIRDKDEYNGGQKLFELVLLDTALNQTWATELELNSRLLLVGYDFVGDWISLLFREGESAESNFELITVALADQATARYKIKQNVNFKLTHFSATPRHVILGGYISSEPSVLIYRPAENQLKVIPGFFLSGMELLDVRVNENFTFNILISARVANNDRKLILRTFDEDGVQLLEDEMELPSGFTALTGVTSSLIRQDLAIVGTYAIGKNRTSTGLYFTLADPERRQPIQFIEYDQIPHFLDYLPPRRSGKIKQQATRARLKGHPSAFRSNVIPLRLAESEHGFALLLETYSASSAMNPNPYSNPYGWGNPMHPLTHPGWTPFASRYYTMPYSFYDPFTAETAYKMLAAQVVVMGDAGDVVNGLQLTLDDDMQPHLEQVSDFLFNAEGTGILYKKESELFSHFDWAARNLPVIDTTKVELSKETEVIRNESEESGGIRWWFRNSFYLWGIQTVRDQDEQVADRTRYVFYVNRVDARP